MWLIFAYSLPASNPKGRVRIWRKLSNIGALQLKSAFYLLPMNDINYEHLEWTVKAVEEMGGDAVFFKSESIENMKDDEIRAMFNAERESDYLKLEEKAREFDAMISEKDVSKDEIETGLKRGIKRFMKQFSSIKEIDFFSSGRAEKTAILIESLSKRLDYRGKGGEEMAITEFMDVKNFKNKTWVTRKNPYIDRIASWWLIKRFIDEKAQIRFVAPSDVRKREKNVIFFDIEGGDFTHKGKMVTFEVIAESFGIKNKGIEYIGKIVHSIDLKDDAYYLEDSKGVEEVIKGIIKISKNDQDVVEKGMIIFDSLYANYKQSRR